MERELEGEVCTLRTTFGDLVLKIESHLKVTRMRKTSRLSRKNLIGFKKSQRLRLGEHLNGSILDFLFCEDDDFFFSSLDDEDVDKSLCDSGSLSLLERFLIF